LEVIGFHARGRELQAVVLNAICDSSEYVVRTACDVVERWELRGGARLCVGAAGEALRSDPAERDPRTGDDLVRY
jgi:hypothetical protein